ncbi:MAG TPA: DUF3037 domain-containing protein [Flavisolibacter sp.]|nr:DUF3037 domain-containing protein [Flavisolibacter sp.]
MQEKQLFEYAVIRVVPRVEREEFLNIGVILYCPGERFLGSLFSLNREKLLSFSHTIELEELEARVCAFENICAGKQEGGPIGRLPIASRFRWLTAARSTILQTSPVHPGLCGSASQTLQKLYEQLVL